MSTNNQDNNTDNTQDVMKMILALQETSNRSRRNTISINPMTALVSAGVIIIVLIQFMIGFGMWSIQDRLKRYDSYESRIVNVEKSLVRFEAIPDSIDDLVIEIRTLTKNFDNDQDDLLTRIITLEKECALLKRDFILK